MLQWPGDCELSQVISYDGALVSAQTCSFGRAPLATASFELGEKRAAQSAQSVDKKLEAESPFCTVIQYSLFGKVHCDNH